MSDALGTYLHDHLAASAFAIDLLKSMSKGVGGDASSELAAHLLPLVQEDREVLQGIADGLGTGSSVVKEAAAWVSEKLSRAKLSHNDGGLGTLQALETLSLGILGKLALWRTLKAISEQGGQRFSVDFQALIVRAEAQHAKVEAKRLLLARSVFS